jgi:hypothetical protein
MAQRGGVALLALRGLVRGGGRLRVTVVEGSREVLLELPLFARVLLGRLHRPRERRLGLGQLGGVLRVLGVEHVQLLHKGRVGLGEEWSE